MTDQVVTALIGAAAVVAAALIGVLFQNVRLGRRINSVHTKTEVVRNQVQNSHGTNLRDDLDAMRLEVREGFKSIADRQDVAAQTVIAVRNEATAKALAASTEIRDLTKRLDSHIDGGFK